MTSLKQRLYERLGRRFGKLWLHGDFRLLWGSFTITFFGGQVTFLALPLTAALLLGATPLQMGILTACGALPFALFSLFAGVLVDRARKLPLIIAADLGRGAALLAIPIAAWSGILSMPLLYAADFLVGVGGTVGWAAYQVFMTERVGRENLIEANSKMALSESAAQLVGPGIAGVAIHWLTAPLAILIDAASFFFSAWMLRTIPASERDRPRRGAGQTSIWREIGDGLMSIWRNALLRSIAWSMALWNLLRHMYMAVIILYATRDLALDAATIGVAWMGGGIGCIVASAIAARANLRLGMGRVMLGGILLTGLAWGLVGLVRPGSAVTTLMFSLGILAFDLGGTLFFINYLTLRQAVTPDHLLGRVTSTMIFLTVVTAPFGSLLAGALAGWTGLREMIWIIAAAGILLWGVLLRASPLAGFRSVAQAVGAAAQ